MADVAAVRRLEDNDVRAVFECLHEGRPPPPHLPFKIVPVGPNGLKLSPPSHEFPDGLFVLLRPKSKGKKKQADPPKAPDHLRHLVIKDGELQMDTCPWSLSGPQFPQPTAIQQRYCYPRGPKEYSGQKGGALWTMYRKDGREDLTYRLLHVYYSAKRAVNKMGGEPPLAMSPVKRLKSLEGPNLASPVRGAVRSTVLTPPDSKRRTNASLPSPKPPTPLPSRNLKVPAVMTASTMPSSSSKSADCESPSSPRPSLRHNPSYQPAMWGYNAFGIGGDIGPFVSPSTPAPAPHKRISRPGFWMRHGQLAHPGAPTAGAPAGLLDPASRDHNNGYDVTRDDRDDDAGDSVYMLDPYPYDEPGATESVAASDMDWNSGRDDDARDALLNGILLKPSEDELEYLSPDSHPLTATNDPRGTGRHGTVPGALSSRMMAWRLDTVRDTIRDAILESPAPDRTALVSVLVHWARSVAADPLAVSLRNQPVPSAQHQQTTLRLSREDDNNNNLYSHHDATSITAV